MRATKFRQAAFVYLHVAILYEAAAYAMWRAGRLPVESLVSSRITLDDINTAMDNLADGTAVRQLISFENV